MKKELSLYIHVPFCLSKCSYCNFVSVIAHDTEIENYIKALKKEIGMRGKELGEFVEIKTIYIGGGTPSMLKPGMVSEILKSIYTNFIVQNYAEISIEINPNSLTREKIKEYLRVGINRFSIGLQCLQANLLNILGRTHDFKDFENAVIMLKSEGANNINTDIIIGIPTQTASDVKETLTRLIEMDIPHISAYILSLEDSTPLKALVDHRKYTIPTEKQTILMYNETVKLLKVNGYDRYEVSNFAKPAHKCKHNLVYWNRKDYLGLGLASHSFIDSIRMENTNNIENYIRFIEHEKVPVSGYEKMTEEQAKEETIMLSLRTTEGLDADAFKDKFGENIFNSKKEEIKNLIELGLLVIDDKNHIKATDAGFLVLNRIILKLI